MSAASTSPETIVVDRTGINKGETLCSYEYIYGGDEGLYPFVNKSQLAEGEDNKKPKIKGMVIKRKGQYVYIDSNGDHWPREQPSQWKLESMYNKQGIKYTDGHLMQDGTSGGQRRNKKRTYKKRAHKKRTHKSRRHRR